MGKPYPYIYCKLFIFKKKYLVVTKICEASKCPSLPLWMGNIFLVSQIWTVGQPKKWLLLSSDVEPLLEMQIPLFGQHFFLCPCMKLLRQVEKMQTAITFALVNFYFIRLIFLIFRNAQKLNFHEFLTLVIYQFCICLKILGSLYSFLILVSKCFF